MTTDGAPPATDPAAVGDVPVCPRHRDRVSYVRCQRCGRPACPECQVAAAVGIQCVDCVREQAKAAPTQRTALGGRARGGPPVVTITIIAVCVVVYLLQRVPGFTDRWMFSPAQGEVQPFRFISSAFLHLPDFPLHIVLNMVALWFVGPYLERSLGRGRYIALYLLSAVGGSVGVLLFASPVEPSWYVGVVGASGAVFGLFGAIFVVLRRIGGDARGMLVLIAINLVFGFVVAHVAWQGHLGGLFVGAALGAAYAYAPRARRLTWAVGATVLMALLLVGVTLLKYAGV
jgi:membrane associated rhomboid family serine protease